MKTNIETCIRCEALLERKSNFPYCPNVNCTRYGMVTALYNANPGMLSTRQLAKYFRVSSGTVTHWRRLGVIPKPVARGHRKYYVVADVVAALAKWNGLRGEGTKHVLNNTYEKDRT